jgi:alpha-L-fucosidase
LSRQWTWFQKATPGLVRDLDELEELFYWCTDNDNMLVINVPPDNSGRIRENEANAVIALGQRLGIKKNEPLPKNGRFISLKANSSASSVLENKQAQFGSQMAVDGGMETRWAAADTLAELIIDLKVTDRFNKISIFEFQDTKKSTVANDIFSNYRFNRIQSYNIDIWKNDRPTINITNYHNQLDLHCKLSPLNIGRQNFKQTQGRHKHCLW